jgi:hypothetical protein
LSGYQDVRGPDGRLLFKFDPERLLVEIVVKGTTYVVDLTLYLAQIAAVIEIDPLAGLNGLTPGRQLM